MTGCRSPEEKKQAYVSNGRYLLDQKEYQKAKVELKNALQIDPEFIQGYLLLATAEKMTGEYQNAYQSLSKAVELDPDCSEARVMLGKLLLGHRVLGKAMVQAETVLHKEPDNLRAKRLKAKILFAETNYKKACTVLEEVRKSGGATPDLYLMLAEIYRHENEALIAVNLINEGLLKYPEAVELQVAMARCKTALKSLDAAEPFLRKAISLAPENALLRIELAQLYIHMDRIVQAEQVVNDLVDNMPGDEKTRQMAVDFWIRQGLPLKATRLLETGLELDPDNIAFRNRLSGIYLEQQELTKAQVVLESVPALSANPSGAESINIKNNLARVMLVKADEKRAEQLIDDVLKIDSNNVDAHILKGSLFLAKQDSGNAVSEFRTVVDRQPGVMEARIGLAWAYVLNNDLAQARNVLNDALEKQSGSDDVLKALAKVNILDNRMKEAELCLKQRIAMNAENHCAKVELGDFYLSLHRHNEALAVYEQVKQSLPDSSIGYTKTACVYFALGKSHKAMTELEQGYAKAAGKKESLIRLVRVLLDNGRFDKAEAICRNHLQTAIDPSFAWLLLGKVYVFQKRYDNAVSAFLQATRKDPTNRDAWICLGTAFESKGDVENAIEVYGRALEAIPDFCEAANNLAFLLCIQGRPDDMAKALDLAEYAHKLKPGVPDVLDTLGWIHYKLGDLNNAETYIRKALEKNRTSNTINSHMDIVLRDLKKKNPGPG